MGVDFSVDDISRDEELIMCREKYADAFEDLIDPLLPEHKTLLVFRIQRSAYLDIDEGPIDPQSLPLASDIAEEFDILLKSARKLEAENPSDLNDVSQQALSIFSSESLERWRDYCRTYPDSRILVSLC